MSEHNIPEVLRDAARIFLKELEGHIAFITSALESTSPVQASPLQQRFHLIRGASGFLGMKGLQTIAKEAEHLYRDEGASLSDEELRKRTRTYLAQLEADRAILATELAL